MEDFIMNDKNIDSKEVATRLRELRVSFGYTQEEAAKLLSIDASYLRHLENGTRSGSSDMLVRLARLYRVSVDYLLTGKHPGYAEMRPVLKVKLKKVIDLLNELYNGL